MFSFNPNNRFFLFVNRLVDVLFLNLLFVLFCVPIITVGASLTAAHAVTLKMVDDEEGYLFKTFWKAFRENFRPATVLWLANAFVLYALWLDYQIVCASAEPPFFAIAAGCVVAAAAFCVFTYAYPLLARYENKLSNTVGNALRIAFRFPGKTLLLLILLALETAVFLWNTPMLIAGSLIGPMIAVYTVSGVAKRIFQKIEDESGVEADS